MRYLVTALALVASLAACDRVKPVTTETTGPVISFTQTNIGTITSVSGVDADDASLPVTFNVLANDPGGVKSITASFFPGYVNACTNVQGSSYSGGADFPVSPLPPDQSASSAPDSGGLVPTELFVIETVQGPFTCDDFQDDGITARPYGQTLTLGVSATNYSGKTTNASFPVTFQLWP